MRKIVLTLLLMMATVSFGKALSHKQIQFVDEFGHPVNLGSSAQIYIYDANTTNLQTLYRDPAKIQQCAQPITPTSTNTPLIVDKGLVSWWSKGVTYKVYVTDGTYSRTLDNLTGSKVAIMWPSFLTQMSGSNYGQNDDINFTFAHWIIDGDTAGRLDMIPGNDGGVLAFGDPNYNPDVWIYGGASSYIFFDESKTQWNWVDINQIVDDNSLLVFGSDLDWTLKCDTAKILSFIPATTDETSSINIGSDTNGADLKIFGATSGEYWMYDASADMVKANTGKALYTLTDAAADQFKVDATGTIAGYAIVFETTDGGIQLNADGASNGDISIDAADDLTLTAGGNLSLAVTGTLSAGGSALTNVKKPVEIFTADDTLTAAESGKVCVSDGLAGAGAGDLTITLPAAQAGLIFTFIDANSVAGDDLVITAAAGDTINGGSAGGSYRCTGDAAKQSVTLVAIDDTRWMVISETGTWANE